MLRRSIERLLWVFPAYRTYGSGDDAPPEDAQLRETVREALAPHMHPSETEIADMILSWLAGEGPGDRELAFEAVRRFQQLSAPIAAKAVEDTAFYRNGTLLSRIDVGFDATRFSMTPEEFLAAAAVRAANHPHAMLATATHDHKRGEDVRARLSLLSQIPQQWEDAVRSWDEMAGGKDSDVDPADRYIAWQTLFGTWPEALAPGDAEGLATYAERLKQWQVKALREAKLRSSWRQPDEEYEARCCAFIERICQPGTPLARSVGALVQATEPATLVAMLGQVAIRCVLPGVPDCYQGCELPDFSLVDPDNRRPVEYEQRIAMLDGRVPEHPKLTVMREALAIRRKAPDLFALGSLLPGKVEGARQAHVLAFSRRHGDAVLDCAVAIRTGAPLYGKGGIGELEAWWQDTSIAFGGDGDATRTARELFGTSPVYFGFRPG
jgi:(1->4)-alpha-D-glucan 1-alpha-D-glucosylmutase